MAAKKETGEAAPKQIREYDAETMQKIQTLAAALLDEINKGDNLHIDIPVRGSSNVSFNEKTKKIELGDKFARRYLFNLAHARRFMQTLLVASYVKKDLLDNNLTATLRDLYYAKKHTIPGTKEDTIDEQKESDLAIVDFEVALDTFRERLHLRAEPKGRIAGEMVVTDRVKDKVDTIDLSKMGSGGWAVPSIVEQVEFKDVGAEYVLVAEKNAIFDRLNEDAYWAKQKCLLMTTGGQAARGARRLLKRLSSELKLPIYCLSIDAGEPITISDDLVIKRPLISSYVDNSMVAYGSTDCGYFEKSLGVGSSVQVDALGKTTTSMVVNTVRHQVSEDLLEITSEAGYSIRVTSSHSIKVFDNEKFEICSKRAEELGKDDYLVCTSKVPTQTALMELDVMDILRESGILDRFYALVDLREKTWQNASEAYGNHKATSLRYGKSEVHLPVKIKVTEDLCRLLGYYVAEGNGGDCLNFTFGAHEKTYVQDVIRIAEQEFGILATARPLGPTGTRITFGGRGLEAIFIKALGIGSLAENKRVPWIVFNSSDECRKEFLRGYFRGDGCLRFSKKGCKLQASTVSRALASDIVFVIHQLGGWANVEKKKSKKSNELDKYHVIVSDKETLKIISDVALDLGKGSREALWNYLNSATSKLSVRKSIPAKVVKQTQKALYHVTGKGIAHLVGNQSKISLDVLKNLFEPVTDSSESILPSDRLLRILPFAQQEAKPTAKAAEDAGLKFITAHKALKRLEKAGLVRGIKTKGRLAWSRVNGESSLTEEDVRKLFVLKNVVESGIALLSVRKVERVKPTTGMVYDIELSPTHSFVAGVGGLLVSNTDADPYGWYIYSCMKYGSMALAHESERLGSRDMKFLGMSISDIEHYDLRSVTIKAKEVDIKRAEEMKAYDWFKAPAWQREIDKFLDKKIKAEIQALSSKSLQYISTTYLPEKIKSQDFLP